MDVRLAGGTIEYEDTGGDGPVIVFVHGALVDARLWAPVVGPLTAAGFRCVTPTWPMGSHRVPVPDADLSPPGVASLIAEFLDHLDLRDVTLAANDSGGAFVQLVLVTRPERVGRAVLTPCDCFESFFPPRFGWLPRLARVPAALALFVALAARFPVLHRTPIGFSALAKRPLDEGLLRAWLRPAAGDAAVRADLGRFLRGVDRRHTLAAARRFPAVRVPVLLAWSVEDRVFPISLAHRLAGALPDARIAPVHDAGTFVAQDRPDRLVELIEEFVGAAQEPGRTP